MKKILVSKIIEDNINVGFKVNVCFTSLKEYVDSKLKSYDEYSVEDVIKEINGGVKYFTKNDDIETPVIVVSDYIKSVPNNSDKDNIDSLPLIKMC